MISPVLGPALVQSAEGSSQPRGPVAVGLHTWGFSLCVLLSSLPLLWVGTQTPYAN